MKILKKIVSVFVVSVMLLGITGCDEKERDNQEGQANEVSNNMLYVGCEKTDDDRKHYFVAGNGETKVYSGYKTMGDFVNGVSLVEVDTEEFTGNMLIDIEENVIFKYKGIEKKDEADIEIYIVTDDEGKKGMYRYILDVEGEKDKVKIPYEAMFNEIAPCYSIDDVYYDYDGKKIIDASKLD